MSTTGRLTRDEHLRIANLMIFGDEESGKALPAMQAYQRVRPCSDVNARAMVRKLRYESDEFQAAYEEELARFRKIVLSSPLATREGQIQELLADLDRLEQIRVERAAEYAGKAPGTSTGLMLFSGGYFLDRAWMDAKDRILSRILELSGQAPDKSAPATASSFAGVQLILPANGSENPQFIVTRPAVQAEVIEADFTVETVRAAQPTDSEASDWQ